MNTNGPFNDQPGFQQLYNYDQHGITLFIMADYGQPVFVREGNREGEIVPFIALFWTFWLKRKM